MHISRRLRVLFESQSDVAFAEVMSRLAYCNPFLPERIQYEREALAEQFAHVDVVWNVAADWEGNRPNIGRLRDRAESLITSLRDRLATGSRCSAKELQLYEDLAVYTLYYRVQEVLRELVNQAQPERDEATKTTFKKFLGDFGSLLEIPHIKMPSGYEAAHLFACYYQVRRAFHYVFRNIVGASMPAA